MNEWKPIESAPIEPFDANRWYMPHSPSFLLHAGYNVPVIGHYSYTEKGKGRWVCWRGNVTPTHWMELPAVPEVCK